MYIFHLFHSILLMHIVALHVRNDDRCVYVICLTADLDKAKEDYAKVKEELDTTMQELSEM